MTESGGGPAAVHLLSPLPPLPRALAVVALLAHSGNCTSEALRSSGSFDGPARREDGILRPPEDANGFPRETPIALARPPFPNPRYIGVAPISVLGKPTRDSCGMESRSPRVGATMAISLDHPRRMVPKTVVVSVSKPLETVGRIEVPWVPVCQDLRFVLIISIERQPEP